MPPKYTSERKFFFIILLLFIINFDIIIVCCARLILFLQPDFLSQKLAIEEIIMNIKRVYIKHQVIY